MRDVDRAPPVVYGPVRSLRFGVVKLDAVDDDMVRRLDRPPGSLSAHRLVRTFAERIGLETQTMLVRRRAPGVDVRVY